VGSLAGISIAGLLVAGVMPALLLSALFVIYVVLRALADPSLGGIRFDDIRLHGRTEEASGAAASADRFHRRRLQDRPQ